MIKIVFSDEFYKVYADEPAAIDGRMESIIDYIKSNSNYEIIEPQKADIMDILSVHSKEYVDTLYAGNFEKYNIATLSAGGAIMASDMAMNGNPAFAAIRPPGHHSYRNQTWGYCYLSNMAIAINRLFQKGKIQSAFILDFDAHTGDGTIDCLKSNANVKIFNPMAEKSNYMKLVEEYLKELPYVDIIGVCAGFDSYEKDCGGKLSTFDFYTIGWQIKMLTKKFGHNRRFATLEGGYYLPDLGKNVFAFCQGFE